MSIKKTWLQEPFPFSGLINKRMVNALAGNGFILIMFSIDINSLTGNVIKLRETNNPWVFDSLFYGIIFIEPDPFTDYRWVEKQ